MKLLILGSILILLTLWLIGRATYIFRALRVTSAANEPTLKPGRYLFLSKLKKPRLLRLIAYRIITPETGSATFVHRICGMPGDTVEIRAGVLYVNGKQTDEALNLQHIYKFDASHSASILYNPKDAYTLDPYPDTLYAPLPDSAVRKHAWPCTRHILPAGLRDTNMYLIFKKNWNPDNFGPIRVPAGHYFVLGDFRNNVKDSRYHGFIESQKVLGTILWK